MPETCQLPTPPVSPLPVRPGCPVCGGTLIPQRGQVRCLRCMWTMCAGCEPVIEPVEDEYAVSSR